MEKYDLPVTLLLIIDNSFFFPDNVIDKFPEISWKKRKSLRNSSW